MWAHDFFLDVFKRHGFEMWSLLAQTVDGVVDVAFGVLTEDGAETVESLGCRQTDKVLHLEYLFALYGSSDVVHQACGGKLSVLADALVETGTSQFRSLSWKKFHKDMWLLN